VFRVVANFGLSILLVAVLLWGGCVSCSQYFAFTASHNCCDPVGHCRKAPVKTTCIIQPMDVTSMAHFIAPDPAVAGVVVVALAAPMRLIDAPADTPLVRESPPDLCKLHSVFRI
jgi:hypothetical protein